MKDVVIDETDRYAACFLCPTAVRLRTLSFCHGSWFTVVLNSGLRDFLCTFYMSSSFITSDSDRQLFRKEFHKLNWVCHIRETYNHRTTALWRTPQCPSIPFNIDFKSSCNNREFYAAILHAWESFIFYFFYSVIVPWENQWCWLSFSVITGFVTLVKSKLL